MLLFGWQVQAFSSERKTKKPILIFENANKVTFKMFYFEYPNRFQEIQQR